jgi:hypothetical protein
VTTTQAQSTVGTTIKGWAKARLLLLQLLHSLIVHAVAAPPYQTSEMPVGQLQLGNLIALLP